MYNVFDIQVIYTSLVLQKIVKIKGYSFGFLGHSRSAYKLSNALVNSSLNLPRSKYLRKSIPYS